MPRLVSMRVSVAADDVVQATIVMDRLRAKFEAMETEVVDHDTPRSRILWCSAEVLQALERGAKPRATPSPGYKPRRGKRAARRSKREAASEPAAPAPA